MSKISDFWSWTVENRVLAIGMCGAFLMLCIAACILCGYLSNSR